MRGWLSTEIEDTVLRTGHARHIGGVDKLEFHGTSFPRSFLATCPQQVGRVGEDGTHEDATRKLLSWNLAYTRRRQQTRVVSVALNKALSEKQQLFVSDRLK